MPHQFEASSKLELLTYVVTSILIMWGANTYRTLASNYRAIAEQLQNEEKLRKLAVDELAHRLKNKIASIQAIINYQLRQHTQLRDNISARLVALSATDDLIMAAQGRGAHLSAILSIELKPYGLARISMQGPDILFTPTLALTMALIIHELSTNAAKYGALSSATGTLSIKWTASGNRMSLEWRERGGPPVTSPPRQGFGLQLLGRALEQFGGNAEMTFETYGLVCTMTALLSESSEAPVPPNPTSPPTNVG